ncbi:succinate dehydrogenase subunit 6, mitochondrial-like [Chenopodium quinoa]|uniref:succinate dehydrogenase subunit 6, mitochondrial-like n=1 Tax=Chenopodium quinoa TaxID=63459 RepID=UPI000B775C39|nr:succinate dehydrogenase subunit 6, mitochondrial-like [Chenopodium quinoa]
MAESPKAYFSGFKDFLSDRFSFLDNYNRFVKRDKPLPSWSESDVQDFIASDPVHGPVLKTAREAVNYGLVGSAVGAVTTAGVCWKYSKSPHGAVLALGAGAVFGWTFGAEIGNHALQLYRLDTLAAQIKFMEWWEKKTEGRS